MRQARADFLTGEVGDQRDLLVWLNAETGLDGVPRAGGELGVEFDVAEEFFGFSHYWCPMADHKNRWSAPQSGDTGQETCATVNDDAVQAWWDVSNRPCSVSSIM